MGWEDEPVDPDEELRQEIIEGMLFDASMMRDFICSDSSIMADFADYHRAFITAEFNERKHGPPE